MARPKESNEVKVKKVYPDAECKSASSVINVYKVYPDYVTMFYIVSTGDSQDEISISQRQYTSDLAWLQALYQIRKAKIKAAKDKRKPPKVVKEIKKHVGLTMYPSDKDMIVKGFGSVQKFLDMSIREYKSK